MPIYCQPLWIVQVATFPTLYQSAIEVETVYGISARIRDVDMSITPNGHSYKSCHRYVGLEPSSFKTLNKNSYKLMNW